eukprot:TRINITY_DN624_c0_g2_i1.p1 TRINITY_DN624_c0_g2~~TRINITY_DN624_c0_g2_i1.p1  ORF type:complete len:682 (+),score=147.99 TRINITY_DN624_c0_g2_i1:72-2117(+)
MKASSSDADIDDVKAQIASVKSKKRSTTRRNSAATRQTVSLGVFEDDEDDKKAGTFVDAAAMKEKVREKLCKPKYNVFNFYHEHGLFQRIAKSPRFEMITLIVISLNALWISVDTDGNKADVLIFAEPRFIVAENLFCFYFSLEWFIRFMSFKNKRDGRKDAWFVFDSVMVLVMVLETWAISAIMLLSGMGEGGGNTGFLKIAKLFRLSRMARMARLMRAMPEMMILIRGMAAAARSVFFTLCLLVVIIYIFAILFVQLTVDTPIGEHYFKDVPAAMFTLLLRGTLLDSVSVIATDFMAEAFYLNLFFFFFVLLAAFTLMNMLIGVLVEVVSAVAAVEKEEMLIGYVKEKLERVVEMVDTDGGGSISKTEFMQILGIEEAIRCLQDVGVDAIGLVDFADFIFHQDDDGEGKGLELDFPEFMDVVLQFRGTNQASVKDMVDLRKFVHTEMKKVIKLVGGNKRSSAQMQQPQPVAASVLAEASQLVPLPVVEASKVLDVPLPVVDLSKAIELSCGEAALLQGPWEPFINGGARTKAEHAFKQALAPDFPPSVDLALKAADLQALPPRLLHSDAQSIQAALPAAFRPVRSPSAAESGRDGTPLNGYSSAGQGCSDGKLLGSAVNGVPPPWADASMEVLWRRVGDRVAMIIDEPADVQGVPILSGDAAIEDDSPNRRFLSESDGK